MTLTNAGLIALVSDILMPITLFTIWLVVVRDQPRQTAKLWAAVLLIGAATLAAAMAWYPPLAAIRLEPAPGAQVAAVALLAFGLPAVLFRLPATRLFLARIDSLSAARIGIWRVVYGSALLAMGLAGDLPEGFYRSVAIGDIAVGLWAVWIATRSNRVSDRHLLAWNVAGLIDLLHVIPLAVIILRPFVIANPGAPTLNLLPLAGVPLFIALHIVTIRNLAFRGREF